MVDSSGSVTQTHFEKMLSFIAHLSRHIGMRDGKTRIGLLKYSDYAKIQFHMNDHQTYAALAKAVMAVPYDPGKTNIAAALKRVRRDMFVRAHGDRPGVPNIGVLLADGYSSVDMHDTGVEADRARHKGIQLFALGIGIEDFDELKMIAADEDRVFSVDGFDSLTDIVQTMADRICKGKKGFIHTGREKRNKLGHEKPIKNNRSVHASSTKQRVRQNGTWLYTFCRVTFRISYSVEGLREMLVFGTVFVQNSFCRPRG